MLVNLVNQMDRSQFDITVLTLFEKGCNAEGLREDVMLINAGKRRTRGMKTLFKFLPKKALYSFYVAPFTKEQYDLVVAYMTGVPTFVAAGADAPKIAWIHGEFFKGKNIVGLKRIYDRFDAVVGVSRYVCECFNALIRAKREAIVIYNTNDVNKIMSLCEEPFEIDQTVVNLVSVGCLEKTKGFDRLISVCSRLKKDGFRFCLRILGEGIERQELQRQIDGAGLKDSVLLLGYCQNPYPVVKCSDLFVCSSRTEGLSTAVSEAVILGVPAVSTDVSGAKEILGEHDEYGLVTENSEEGLYEGIKRMLSDESLPAHYRQKAAQRAAFFATENTVRQAEGLFRSVTD